MARCRAKVTQLLGPNVYTEVPDGGWGWVVAAAFFMVEVFTYGIIKSFGIFLQDLMNEFDESNTRVSWIVSICVFVMTFNAPLSSVMTNRFGFQVVVMIGGLLISTGTIATSFCTSVNQIYITYGIVTGLGYCLTFLPTVTILSKYFTRRRSLATAVASTGESLSMFALAPAFSALKENIGWRHTVAVLGALQGIIIVCGALLRPIIIKPRSSSKELEALGTLQNSDVTNSENSVVKHNELTGGSVITGDSGVQSLKDSRNLAENHFQQEEAKLEAEAVIISKAEMNESKTEKPDRDAEKQVLNGEKTKPDNEQLPVKLLDFSILRECSFIMYSLFGLFATLGFFAPPLYIIELSVSRGVERDHSAYMLSTMAVAEIFGRFTIGWVLTRKQFSNRKLLVLLACVIVMTADLVGFTLVTELYGLGVCCAFFGFFMGTLSCSHIPMLAEDDVVGIERMSSAAGVYVFIQSFAGLAGPPLGGALVDVTKNYGAAFYSCAVGMGLSAVFLGLVKPCKRGIPCCRKGLNHSEDEKEKTAVSEEQSGGQKPEERTNSISDFLKSDLALNVSQMGAGRDADEGTASS